MKLKMIYLFFVVLSFTSCQNNYRKPSSSGNLLQLQKETENILAHVKHKDKFELDSCATYLKNVYQDVLTLSTTRYDLVSAKENWQNITLNLWKIRTELRQKLIEFSSKQSIDHPELISCVAQMREGFRLSRSLEDYLAESFSGGSVGKTIPLKGESPSLFINQPKFEKITIRSGDVILSRGQAYTTSAIAKMTDNDSSLSQAAFIYIQGDGTGKEYSVEEALKNPKVLVLEAHLEVGSTIRTFKEYLDDQNVRYAIFRYTDPLIAHRSARWAHDSIQNYRKRSFDSNPLDAYEDASHNVPYNFQMVLERPENPKKLFNSQVVHIGFHSNNINLPAFISTLNVKLPLAKKLGITSPTLFLPGDLEFDPRFELVGEYRNLKKLKSLRIKDIVLSGIFKMMEQGYELTPAAPSTYNSVFGWALRQMDAKFAKPQVPKNMNLKLMSHFYTLEKVALVLERELQKEEANFQKTSKGLPLSYSQGLEVIEKIRIQDQEVYLARKAPKFHWDFKPPGLKPETKAKTARK